MIVRTVKEEEVYPNEKPLLGVQYRDRPTTKVIICNSQGEIALAAKTSQAFVTLPGGGVDEGETFEDAARRECKEEIGATIELGEHIGVIDEYRSKRLTHQITHCYCAKIVGPITAPSMTEREELRGHHIVWMPLEKVIATFKQQVDQLRQKTDSALYHTGFNVFRDYLFLQEYIRLQQQNTLS